MEIKKKILLIIILYGLFYGYRAFCKNDILDKINGHSEVIFEYD